MSRYYGRGGESLTLAIIFMAVMVISVIAILRWSTRYAQTVKNPKEATQRWMWWAAIMGILGALIRLLDYAITKPPTP